MARTATAHASAIEPQGRGRRTPRRASADPSPVPPAIPVPSPVPSPVPATPSGLRIVYRPIGDLVPYARNSRTHSPTQITKLRQSLARFGWTNPILLAGETVIAGHARLQAALAMAKDSQPIRGNDDPWLAPTIDLAHLSEDERRAYVITDNRLALDAGWDKDLLRAELADLKINSFDLTVTGFSAVQLRDLVDVGTESAERGISDALGYQVIVDCSDEQDQARMIETFRAQGMKCRPLIL
jgi:hypothetical protein